MRERTGVSTRRSPSPSRTSNRILRSGWGPIALPLSTTPRGTTTVWRQNIDVDTVMAEKFGYYRKAWQAFGHPGPMPRMMVARHVHVAESDAQARAEAERYLLQGFFGQRGMEIIKRTRLGFGGDPRWTGGERTPEIEERGRVFREITKSYDFWIDNGLALVGSPETVIRRLKEQQKFVGYNVFCCQQQIGDMSKPLVRKSRQLFGEQVIPAFSG